MRVFKTYVTYGLLPAVLSVLVYVAYERHPHNTPPTVTAVTYSTSKIESIQSADVTTVISSGPGLSIPPESSGRLCVGDVCLTDLYRLVTADACGTIPCGNGRLVVTDACRCVCDEGWSGPACNVYACPPNSVLTPTGCRCQWGWTSASNCTRFRCSNGVEVADPALCLNVTCLEPASPTPYGCLCLDAWRFGDACQYTCNSPDLSYSLCPGRAYWGWDQFVSGRGICGMNVQASPPGARQVQMTCLDGTSEEQCRVIWERERLHCCAPYADCQSAHQPFCQSPECCYSLTDNVTCLAAGCAWCGHGCFNTTYIGCQQPDKTADLHGIWTSHWTPCTADTYKTVACEKAVAEYQAGLWKTLCNNTQTDRCDSLLENHRQTTVVPQLVARGAIEDAVALIRSTGHSLELCDDHFDTEMRTVCWSNGVSHTLLHVAPSPNTSFPLMLVLQSPEGVWCLTRPLAPPDFVFGTGLPWPGTLVATAVKMSDVFLDFSRCGWFVATESAIETAIHSLVVTNVKPSATATWIL